MRVKTTRRGVKRHVVRMVPDGLRKAEAGARPKPKWLARLDAAARATRDASPRLRR